MSDTPQLDLRDFSCLFNLGNDGGNCAKPWKPCKVCVLAKEVTSLRVEVGYTKVAAEGLSELVDAPSRNVAMLAGQVTGRVRELEADRSHHRETLRRMHGYLKTMAERGYNGGDSALRSIEATEPWLLQDDASSD